MNNCRDSADCARQRNRGWIACSSAVSQPAHLFRGSFALIITAIGLIVSGSLAADKAPEVRDLATIQTTNEYHRARSNVLQRLSEGRFSSDIRLTPEEVAADQILSARRTERVRMLRQSGTGLSFGPARPFAEIKKTIEGGPGFQFIKKMPKGALLHVHWPSCGRVEWLLTKVLQDTNCYVYWPTNLADGNRGTIQFATADAVKTNSAFAGYVAANTLRKQMPEGEFDRQMQSLLTMPSGSLSITNPWGVFGQCFVRSMNVWGYQPLFCDYLLDTFNSYLDDGIQHVEMRLVLQPLFDLTGRTWPETEMLEEFRRARELIRKKAPEFNLKVILTNLRWNGSTNAWQLVEQTVKYQKLYPDLVIGCDLVGDEDNGRSTLDDVPALLPLARTNLACRLFLHDGESCWTADHNLIDAVLLRPKRIGHGFNLFRFPLLESYVVTNNIALEICPISNQALGLIHDLRIHPAAGYLNRGVQCVLGSDDPLLFGNTGLSYDFWEVFQAWSLDLAALKKLALNSLDFASLTPEEHRAAVAVWKTKWTNWVNWVSGQSMLLPLHSPASN